MKNIFIIGSKGIPANYGGFETFVDKLVDLKKSDEIKYHVSCLSMKESELEYKGCRCFNVPVKNIGSARAIIYDIKSLIKCVNYIKNNNISRPIIYILACRIGPFLQIYKWKLKKMGIKVYINPDGHEWKRSKWNWIVKKYWKYSERLMVKNSDMLICDSLEIERYINTVYKRYNPKTTFIAYGADIKPSILNDNSIKLLNWNNKNNIVKGEYYLIVGRFVPENNYETMISEFMKSRTNKKLVIISNVEKNKFYDMLLEKTKFTKDNRICFAGTVYDGELLKKIRENAYAYIHGHEVGGTNPSLLEALASTKLNILLKVPFNKEVGGESSIYFSKDRNSLSKIIDNADKLNKDEISKLEIKAKNIINNRYSWDIIINKYENVFLK